MQNARNKQLGIWRHFVGHMCLKKPYCLKILPYT